MVSLHSAHKDVVGAKLSVRSCGQQLGTHIALCLKRARSRKRICSLLVLCRVAVAMFFFVSVCLGNKRLCFVGACEVTSWSKACLHVLHHICSNERHM